MPLILAENLTKHYRMVHAVDNPSLEVEEDSVIGLIGPNGAGKTTRIKMILSIEGGSASLEELYRQVVTQKGGDQP